MQQTVQDVDNRIKKANVETETKRSEKLIY